MFVAYLTLAFRILMRNPFLTAVDIVGLSIGFSSFFILWQHAVTELQTDQYHQDFEKIARIGLTYRWSDDLKTFNGVMTSGAIRSYSAPLIADDHKEVADYTRILQQSQFQEGLVGHGIEVVLAVDHKGTNAFYREDKVVYADPNIFNFFTLPLLHGAKDEVLQHPGNVVLSQAKARQYFGSDNPVGETLVINDAIILTVTGVFENLPHTTHLNFDIVISNEGLLDRWQEQFAMTLCYVKLDSEESLDAFGASLFKRTNKYFFEHDLNGPRLLGFQLEFFLQPLEEIAFTKAYEFDSRPQSKSKQALIFLQVVSILVLLMAWINYINLSISRTARRMKELATRKISGALSSNFLSQFLIESALINFMAVMMALTIMQLIRIPAATFFEVHIPEFKSIEFDTWLMFIGMVLLGTLVTGGYPALMSASFSPRALFSISRIGSGKRVIQSSLTVIQYATALSLMLWAFISYLQLDYIQHKSLGIHRDEVVIVDAPATYTSQHDFENFANLVRAAPGVRDATSSFSVVGDNKVTFLGVGGVNGWGCCFAMDTNGGVDENFIPFYGIRLLAGRNFKAGEDSSSIIISRHAASRMSMNPQDAIGVQLETRTERMEERPATIIGVVEDYRFKPLLDDGEASTESVTGRGVNLTYKNSLVPWFSSKKLSLRIDMSNLKGTIGEIEMLFASTFPGNIFTWYFLDDHVNHAYRNDRISINQITFFSFIAIGISCLGLLGLMSIVMEEKTKELGIRKVLGAGAMEIGLELLKAVYRPAVLAVIVALPVAWYLADQSLSRYLDRISLQWWHFVVPVACLLMIMTLTVTYLLVKAMRTNPVESLRYE